MHCVVLLKCLNYYTHALCGSVKMYGSNNVNCGQTSGPVIFILKLCYWYLSPATGPMIIPIHTDEVYTKLKRLINPHILIEELLSM